MRCCGFGTADELLKISRGLKAPVLFQVLGAEQAWIGFPQAAAAPRDAAGPTIGRVVWGKFDWFAQQPWREVLADNSVTLFGGEAQVITRGGDNWRLCNRCGSGHSASSNTVVVAR
jgi:hypothetical protein